MTKKTLKDFLEVYKPKSPDEQKFVDKHVTIKHKDRNGNGDDVFNGNTKYIKRKEERHGYDVGDDEKVYEEVEDLDEAKKKILLPGRPGWDEYVKNRNAKAKRFRDAMNTKLPDHKDPDAEYEKARHKVANPRMESVEDLDELSQKMVRAYRDKARDDKESAEDEREYYKAHDDNTDDEDEKIRKRSAGIKMASKKIHGGAKVPVKEELEIEALLDEALDLLLSIDEKTLTPAEMKKREEVVKAIKRGNPKMDKSIAYAIATKTAKRVAESSDEYGKSIDTIKKKNITNSDKDKLARLHAMMSAEKKPVKEEIDKDLEDELKAQRQTKKSVSGKWKSVSYKTPDGRWATKDVKEEAEELDELSFQKLAAYTSKSADSVSGAPVRKQDNRIKGQSLADKKIRKMGGYSSTAKVAATNEEVEDLEELSKKTLSSYAKKAVNQTFSKGVAGGMGLASSNKEDEASGHRQVNKAAKRMAGAQKAIGKLTKEDIINRTIEKYVPEEMKFTPEERLLKRLEGLSEGHIATLLGLFEALNNDNQIRMIETVETREGINELLDFALVNRGE